MNFPKLNSWSESINKIWNFNMFGGGFRGFPFGGGHGADDDEHCEN